jgi:nucleoside-diphosphate-sugar epimerase
MSLRSVILLVIFTCLLFFSSVLATEGEDNFLSEDSVVLIVGATTSLLGSEVALALHRLFHCHVVLVDDLPAGTGGEQIVHTLSTLEFHRQSLFRIWQEVDERLTVYRMNPRPIIPDIDPGTTVDRLEHVFAKHLPTHVFLLPPEEAPESFRGETEDAPPRAGILEGLLEQVRVYHENFPTRVPPHVVWTSSEEVYPPTGIWKESSLPPMPSSKRGTDALVNEVIAQAYDDKGVASVVLRFSKHIYGPFQQPSTPIFGMMEALLNNQANAADASDAGDYLFVDDAVDAVLAALQLPTQSHSFALNIASGDPMMTTEEMQGRVRTAVDGSKVHSLQGEGRRLETKLAEQVLNFRPRVSLGEGLARSLAWHYDRMYPYGSAESLPQTLLSIAHQYGVVSCHDESDSECLRGVPVLPCASECAHAQQCRSTPWDELIPKIQAWTASCSTVLYTIRQSSSRPFRVSPSSKSYWPDPQCNIVFMPSASPGEPNLQKDWTTVPVGIELMDVDAWLIPLWSPGRLFTHSQWAIYSAPNVAWDNLDRLMEAVHMQPDGEPGSTALLIGTHGKVDRPRNMAQREAYRALHIKAAQFVDHEKFHDGFGSAVDANSWMVHRLGDTDSEQLRCDVTKELSGWKGTVDMDAAAAFVFGLHDLWSQVLLHQKDKAPWWHGDNVVSIPEKATSSHRRLQEKNTAPKEPVETTQEKKSKPEPKVEVKHSSHETAIDLLLRLNIEESSESDLDEDGEELVEDVHHFDHNGFGVTRQAIGAASNKAETEPDQDDDDGQIGKDDDGEIDSGFVSKETEKNSAVDPSNYDTWLGVLSSSNTRLFVRIVESQAVGAVFLDEYGA